MTRYISKNIKCPCGQVNKVTYARSICIWMMDNIGWMYNMLRGRYNILECVKCGSEIRINSPVLISCIKGGFEINPREDPQKIQEIFREWELIDEGGKPIDELDKRLSKIVNATDEEREQMRAESEKKLKEHAEEMSRFFKNLKDPKNKE